MSDMLPYSFSARGGGARKILISENSGAKAPLEEFTTTDGAGNFYWKKDPVTYVPPTSGADPEKILTVGVSEPKSGCFSATSIKLGEFMTL